MKLHQCKCCKIEVSPRAKSCPNCGEPNPARGGTGYKGKLARLALIFIIFFLLIAFIFDGGEVGMIPPGFYLGVLLVGGFFVRLSTSK